MLEVHRIRTLKHLFSLTARVQTSTYWILRAVRVSSDLIGTWEGRQQNRASHQTVPKKSTAPGTFALVREDAEHVYLLILHEKIVWILLSFPSNYQKVFWWPNRGTDDLPVIVRVWKKGSCIKQPIVPTNECLSAVCFCVVSWWHS